MINHVKQALKAFAIVPLVYFVVAYFPVFTSIWITLEIADNILV
jgi:hypothetical protein